MSTHNLNEGALAPVTDEFDCLAPVVSGEIPRELNGTLIRNGPNPFNGHFDGDDVLAWWGEAAMLHGITFSDGKALVYRNRWVRTKNWANYVGADSSEQQIESNPSVNVIKHAGSVLALAEGGQPVTINLELETLGTWGASTNFCKGMTAHPKIDPITQELITFQSSWNEPWLRYGVVDANGTETLDMEIAVPAPSMMHDIAITETHSILMDLNVGYDFSMLQHGYQIPICWQESRQSRLCIIPRHGGKITWIEIEPCFIQHVVNAHDTPDGNIVLDVARYPWYLKRDSTGQDFLPNPLAVLWRYTLDMANGTVKEQQLGDLQIELPRINDALTGRKNRYLYAVEQPTDQEMRGLVRYDLRSGSTQHHQVSPGDQNSEPIFVPRAQGSTEDDGWVLVSVYRKASNTSEIRILDAQNISDPPLATISFGRRIPAGFHGAWITAE
jgi:carotenoid cleavage dioxygenase-like enzyme